jgi:hypothetical protein
MQDLLQKVSKGCQLKKAEVSSAITVVPSKLPTSSVDAADELSTQLVSVFHHTLE